MMTKMCWKVCEDEGLVQVWLKVGLMVGLIFSLKAWIKVGLEVGKFLGR